MGHYNADATKFSFWSIVVLLDDGDQYQEASKTSQ